MRSERATSLLTLLFLRFKQAIDLRDTPFVFIPALSVLFLLIFFFLFLGLDIYCEDTLMTDTLYTYMYIVCVFGLSMNDFYAGWGWFGCNIWVFFFLLFLFWWGLRWGRGDGRKG